MFLQENMDLIWTVHGLNMDLGTGLSYPYIAIQVIDLILN